MKSLFRRRWLDVLALLALVSGMLGCAVEVGSDEQRQVDETQQALFTAAGKIGPWTIDDILVCYSAKTVALPNYPWIARDTRTWIEETYGRILNLRFYGWGECPADPQNAIILNIDNGSGGVTGPAEGPVNKTRKISVGLNYGGGFREVLMHEFAHALGFSHERKRKDGDGACQPVGKDDGQTYGTPFDNHSITMSTYCGDAWSNLSPWDVVGMRRAYGRKPRGSIVGYRNKCLDVDNPTTSNPPAKQTQVWDCLGNKNQVWSIEHDWQRLATAWSRGVLDVQWGNTANYTPTWNWERNNSPAQQWNFLGVEVRGMGDLCLDVPNGNFVAGQQLQLWECVGNDNQKWNVGIDADNTISLRSTASPGLCVAIGSQPTLQPCGNSNTILSYGDGQIWRGRTRCLDVSNANASNGTPIVSYGCRATGDYYRQAQEWTFRGPIRGLGGKCLQVDTTLGVRAGSKTFINTCSGLYDQVWEYYF